jgi:hypothetical protein
LIVKIADSLSERALRLGIGPASIDPCSQLLHDGHAFTLPANESLFDRFARALGLRFDMKKLTVA